MSNSFCDERSIKLWKFCISEEDCIVIMMNVVTFMLAAVTIYFNKIKNRTNTLSVNVKNNFGFLGEGSLASYYSSMNVPQKTQSTKKKVQMKSSLTTVYDKGLSNMNDLKCNSCGRTVQVTYQYTINKLNQ